MATYTMVGNTKITSSTGIVYRTLTIPAMSHCKYVLTLTLGSYGSLPSYTSTSTASAQTLSLPYGTKYSIAYTADAGYSISKTSDSGTMGVNDVGITAPTASLIYYTLTVGACTNETYKVTGTANSTYGGTIPSDSGGNSSSKTFSCPYYSTMTVTYTATDKTGYSKTASSAVTVTMTGDQNVNTDGTAAASYSLLYYNLTVPASSNCTYSVSFSANSTYGGTVPSSVSGQTAQKVFSCPYGSTATVTPATSLSAKTGYSISTGAAKTYTMTSAQTATQPSSSYSLLYYNLTVPASSNCTYSASFTTNSTYGGTLPSNVSGQTAQKVFSCPYGATATVTPATSLSAKTGYSISTGAAKTYTMTSAQTATQPASSYSLLYYTLSTGATTYQTYAVTFATNSTYGGTLPSNVSGQTAAKSFSCPYGSTATVAYTASSRTGYSVTASSSVAKTMTAAQSVSAATASCNLLYYNLTVGAATNQTYAISGTTNSTYGGTIPTASGQTAAKTVSCPYGSTMYVTYTGTAKTGYSVTATAKQTKTMTTTQSVGAATATYNLLYYTLSVGDSTNQTFTVSGSTNSTYGGTLTTVTARSAAWSGSEPYGAVMYVTYTAASATAQYTYTASGTQTKTMTSAQSVGALSATATTNKYTVTMGTHTGADVVLSASGLTSVTNANLTNVPYNTTVTATATGQSGYTVSSVSFS